MTATIPNLPSLYDPFSTEAKWQKFWEDNQVYKADPNKGGEPYCIVIPPPNVTGSLHMGHAFESALIDTLVRYHRMQGRNTLWLPGTDHASIAVHSMLEKQLKTEGKTRYELGREKFLERAWQWKAESEGTILNQLRRLGVSVDWSRERFTLDEGLSKAVVEAFTRLYEEGLIYRGEYLVNWCPASQSAVSDVEVENQEVNGNLWHLRYPLTDGSGFVEVATTRPETMLGDTAVAVNPNDDRYKHLIGKTLTLPIVQREIPIIGDEFVDPAFGTGCVKVTPAHDPNDFDMGKRHNLPLINIMNKDGTLNANAGEFQGQDRFVARKNVVSRLEADGFLVKIEDYKHTVPYSDRGKVPIEPLLSTQWFVKIRPLADQTLEFLDQQTSPEFVPQRWTKVYRDWLVKLTDWCISRQLWWGHQIPAWYAISETDGQITDNTPFVVAKSETEAWEKAKAQFGENVQLEQDPDVLDTWFSSGLWPFSTLGWPEQTHDLATYYPTTTLVTGFDIIFFWVARMTMMAGHFTGQMPFQTVYIHGLVLDEKGQKMSKTKGNGIDPLLLIDKYGTDALRYTLIREVAGAGQNIRLEYDRKKDESASVEASRNFTNKLWNAARFVIMNLDGQTPQQLGNPVATELSDRWIISRYHQVIKQTTNYIDNYGLGEAAKGLYEFIWGDFCDQYIELVKSRLQADADPVSRRVAQQTLGYILEGIMKLLHPFMPHITEEIWQTLTQQPADSPQTLPLQIYPQVDANLIDQSLEEQFELLIATIRTIRNLRAEADIKPGVKVIANLQTESEKEREILTAGQDYIKDLAKVETLTITDKQENQSVATRKPQRGLKTIGLIIVAIVFGRVGLAVGYAIDETPIVGTFFELVGFGYTAWFVSQNLLTAQARLRLWRRIFSQRELEQPQKPENAIAGVIGTIQVLIPLSGVVDIEAVRAKLEKSLSKAEAEVQSLSTRLNNPSFVDRARADVVQGARDALAEAQKQTEILRDRLKALP
ncbi:valine--tRNA ligase [Nostoc sp. 'Lobaria pulmonaria (5183) cyanobiont']|uniref:valine--tRNA ligase n=1 Tax=Nostoc sp. 'Lobaria pulmonaria (5183) cyanobiont' TaxID=1618022 RepID=UPI000CF31041|nr:valine--tRNA ligase [Nostoc sp. 'Lobaria pulmonaria (5183) cyanobiont']AVH70094.1 valyl-tRNA synthetase [Nostoc sp. 'Lobaria pulmonaria (5183) cyanobiont']